MLIFLILFQSQGLFIELFSDLTGSYLTRQQIGGQSLVFQLSFDTDLLIVLDYLSNNIGDSPLYKAEGSISYHSISASSEQCWNLVQIHSTNECAFTYTSSTNYTCEGALSLEKVVISGVTLEDITFGRILKQSAEITTSGIFGLGLRNLNKLYTTPLFEKIITEKGLKAVFGLCNKEKIGALHIGGFDSYYTENDFFILPILYNNRISVYITEISLNSQSYSSYIEAKIDPAVPYIYLPYDHIVKLIKSMKDFYKDSCQQALCEIDGHLFFGTNLIRPPSEFPNISINIGGLEITLKGFLTNCGDLYCSVIRSGGDYGIIGSPILKQFYLVVDLENSKIGFAKVDQCDKAAVLTSLNQWEQSFLITCGKLTMMFSALAMILVIGW